MDIFWIIIGTMFYCWVGDKLATSVFSDDRVMWIVIFISWPIFILIITLSFLYSLISVAIEILILTIKGKKNG